MRNTPFLAGCAFAVSLAIGCGGGQQSAAEQAEKDRLAAVERDRLLSEREAKIAERERKAAIATEDKKDGDKKSSPPAPPTDPALKVKPDPDLTPRKKPAISQRDQAFAKWEQKIKSAKLAFVKVEAEADQAISDAEAAVESLKKNPPQTKRVKEAEAGVKRAQEAIDFAMKRGDQVKVDEAKKYLATEVEKLEFAKAEPLKDAIKSLEFAKASRMKLRFQEPLDLPATLAIGEVAKLGTGGQPLVFHVFQVIDEENALLGFDKKLYWVEFSTAGLTDGEYVTLKGLVEFIGTRQYKTVIDASNTVRVLREYP